MADVKNNYIFPDFLGQAMSKISTKVQLEGSMMSMVLIFIGLILSGFYLVLYTNFELWYKIVLVGNILAGMLFMISNLVTTFQSYQAHCEILEFQKQQKVMKGGY